MTTTDATSQNPGEDLSWLLERWLEKVPGADSAMLASRDGMRLALAGLTVDQADNMAAITSGIYSLGKGVRKIKDPNRPGGVRQVLVEGDEWHLFVMSAGAGLPRGVPVPGTTDPGTVSTLLGVLTPQDADLGLVGHEMAQLASSVAEYLTTPTRRGQ